jgi:hypothetical protein
MGVRKKENVQNVVGQPYVETCTWMTKEPMKGDITVEVGKINQD